MNFLTDAAAGVVKAVGDAADSLFTSDEERLKANLEAQRIGLEAAKIDADLIKGQQEINKEEAKSASLWTSGWRPGVGWTGVVALVYQYILYPLLTWGWAMMQAKNIVPSNLPPPPLLDTNALMVLLTGILGISTARTFEKVRGVAST